MITLPMFRKDSATESGWEAASVGAAVPSWTHSWHTQKPAASQIIASLTRKRIAEREADIRSLPLTQTEKDNALAKCRLSLRAWRTKKPMLCLHAITDGDGHPLGG